MRYEEDLAVVSDNLRSRELNLLRFDCADKKLLIVVQLKLERCLGNISFLDRHFHVLVQPYYQI